MPLISPRWTQLPSSKGEIPLREGQEHSEITKSINGENASLMCSVLKFEKKNTCSRIRFKRNRLGK
jgi:hypothetical protein